MKIKVLTAALLLSIGAFAQSPTVYSQAPAKLLSDWTTDLIAIPTGSAVTVTSNDAWITGITLVGPASGSVHVTLACKSSGNPVLNGTGISAATLSPVPIPHAVWCRGGFTIVGDASGAYYQVVFRQ
jgi:hypothetical protein